MIYLITGQGELFLNNSYVLGSVEDCLSYFKKKDAISVDTETEGFDIHTKNLITLQLGDVYNQFVIDTSTIDIRKIKELLETKLLLLQHAKFDLRFFYKKDIYPTKVYDTYLAEEIIYMGKLNIKKSLDEIAYRYCKVHLDKSIRGGIHREGLSERVIKYAADDVKYLPIIKRKQEEKIKELGLENAVSLDNEFVKVLAYIEYSGFKLDTDKWKAKVKEDSEALLKAYKALDAYVLENEIEGYVDNQLNIFDEPSVRINWASPKQVVGLFKKLDIDVVDKEGKESVDSNVLKPQEKDFDIIPLYLKFKQLDKQISTYGNNWFDYVNSETGRIHSTFRQILKTGRLSSGQKGNKKKGIKDLPNMQNIPSEKRTRSCFVAERGNVLIVCDFNGQEQIVLANVTKDPGLLDFYKTSGSDMHSFIASNINNIPLDKFIEAKDKKDVGEKLKKEEEQLLEYRQEAKAAGFAINYGGVGFTIANNLSISVEEGDRIYEEYFKVFPKLKQYFDKVEKDAISKGYILFNKKTYRKHFIDFYDHFKKLNNEIIPSFWSRYREEKHKDSEIFLMEYRPKVREYFFLKGKIRRFAQNYPIQGTSSDITKLAAVYVFRELRKRDLLGKVWMPNIIHDR